MEGSQEESHAGTCEGSPQDTLEGLLVGLPEAGGQELLAGSPHGGCREGGCPGPVFPEVHGFFENRTDFLEKQSSWSSKLMAQRE